MVSTRPPTSKSSSPFSNPLVTVPKALITIGIIVTFIFQSFFNSLARSRYLSFFSHSFSFILWSAGTAKFTILQILFVFFFFFFCFFFFFLLIIIRSRLLAENRLSVCSPIIIYYLFRSIIIISYWKPYSSVQIMFYVGMHLVGRIFANGTGDRGSIPGRVIPKTQKKVLDASLLNTRHYKVWIKDKVEQSRESSSALLYTSV